MFLFQVFFFFHCLSLLADMAVLFSLSYLSNSEKRGAEGKMGTEAEAERGAHQWHFKALNILCQGLE